MDASSAAAAPNVEQQQSSEKRHASQARKAYNFPPGGACNLTFNTRGQDPVIARFTTDTLPALDDLLTLLRTDRPPLPVINDLALLYYRAERLTDFERLLELAKHSFRSKHGGAGVETDDDEAIASVDYEGNALKDMAKTHDMLGTYYMWKNYKSKQQASQQSADRETRKKRNAGIEFAAADKLGLNNPLHVAARGFFLLLEKGKVEQAASSFEFAISHNAGDVTALLGRAMCHFAKAEYKKALDHFRKVMMKTNFKCSPDIRYRLSLSRVQLIRCC